ncbi:hypothetical protein GCM10010387_24520 [Streptomyces inusitatus]|uniref:Uncharacterized protein n=1 Tax=Streptomyces inusitatus TaxID=68221 RepID=A0A918Q0Z9_9ACTN|nr:hypothetical protein [Streptomyces inusitatus]GGZ30104.1 hypothetical protein GCM10010387_24520 [Streptomyces inusitatus]
MLLTTPARRRAAVAVAFAGIGTAGGLWWVARDTTPYGLRDSPAVRVEVRAEDSRYPDTRETAEDVGELVRVYVQRLLTGDGDQLAEVGAPWFTGREAQARDWIKKYGEAAEHPVRAVVREPVVPHLAQVELRFGGGGRQVVELTRDDGIWWVAMGDGDPAKP